MNEGLNGTAMVTGLAADVVRTLTRVLMDGARTLASALAHSHTALVVGAVLFAALILIGLVIRIAWLFAILIAALVILSQLVPSSAGTALQTSQVAVCHSAAITCGLNSM